MSKIWPQGSSIGEVFRDDDEMGVYKPSDAPAIADGSQNKKKTLLSLREWLSTALASLSTGFVTLTGLLTVSGSGITSSSATIDMQKSVTISGMSGSVDSRIETNTTNISSNDGDIVSVNGRVDTNDADILILDGDILALQTKTPQSYKTTDAVTFATINTGQGANELYDMNQNVKNTDAVTFATVNTGYGANEVVPEDLYTNKIETLGTVTLPSVAVKQTGHIACIASGGVLNVELPALGSFSYTISAASSAFIDSSSSTPASTVILILPNTNGALVSYKRIS